MSTSNSSKILKLFENPIISQISMLLLFHREVTAGQLAKAMGKVYVSTITRNLEKLHKEDLIHVSRTEAKGNLQVKYWALNPEVVNIDALITDETIDQLSGEEQKKAIRRLQNILIAFRGILKTIYDVRVENLINYLQRQNQEEDSDIFTIFLFNEETGRLFETKFKEFQKKFFEEHREDSAGLDSINSESIITFMLSSRLGDVIPPIQK